MKLEHATIDAAEVLGVGLDAQSRCGHYASPLDIIAIRFKCCGRYYACKDCHDALAGHEPELWTRDDEQRGAVRCGACAGELTIREYLDSQSRCPRCRAPFNPRCANHYQFYFDFA